MHIAWGVVYSGIISMMCVVSGCLAYGIHRARHRPCTSF